MLIIKNNLYKKCNFELKPSICHSLFAVNQEISISCMILKDMHHVGMFRKVMQDLF